MMSQTCGLLSGYAPLTDSRNIVSSVAVRSQRESEEKSRELAEKVAAATIEHIRHKFESDLAVLRERVAGAGATAKEAALDAKYLSQRQMTLALHGLVSVLDMSPVQNF